MQASPRLSLSDDEAKALTARIQDAGTEVVKAKATPLPSPLLKKCQAVPTVFLFAT